MIQQEVAEPRKVPEQSSPVRDEERQGKTGEDEEGDDEEELALWSPEVQVLELEKGEQGLGFSILDYQVCTSVCLSLCL